MESSEQNSISVLELTTSIVAAYVSNNRVERGELTGLIATVVEALTSASAEKQKPSEPAPLVPAISVKKSVTDDYIICLEDGKKFKSLKRHLMTAYDLTPDAYREKWGLPSDYPMVAPAYAAARSVLAKQIGLGRKASPPEPRAEIEPESEPAEAAAPKRRAPRKVKEAV